VPLGEGHEILVKIERGDRRGRIGGITDTTPIGFGIECLTARSSASKNFGVGSAGTERMTPPAIRKPNAWIG